MNKSSIRWILVGIGGVFSAIFMALVARKWRLPVRRILPGLSASVALGAIPFVRPITKPLPVWVMAVRTIAQAALSFIIMVGIILERFMRDPERVPPAEENAILSPTDGVVAYIREIEPETTPLVTKNNRDYKIDELLGTNVAAEKAYVMGIEMNVLDVHVNRCPIDGEVQIVKPIKGSFMSLRHEEGPFLNARCTTLIENPSIGIGVVQIASRLVRRVENYLEPGQTVFAGQRLGFIRLGSLVALVIPRREDVSIRVKVGQHVKAGLSVLAHYSLSDEIKVPEYNHEHQEVV